MARWTYRLADSTTMRNIAGVSPVSPMWGPSLNLVYNRPGQFSAKVPIDSDLAIAVEKHKHCIVAERNGVAKWSGSVTGIQSSASSDPGAQDTTTITATGWFDELNRRYVQALDEGGLIFSTGAQTAGEIIFGLLAQCALREDSAGNLAPMRIVPGARTDTQTRIRSYKRGTSYGSAITELVDIENGVDIYVNPISRRLDVHAWDEYVDRPDVHFTLGMTGFGDNVLSVDDTDDGTSTTNALAVSGAGSTRILVDDPDEIARLGVMLEDEISLSDVLDINIITSYAVAEIMFRRNGAKTLSVTPASLAVDDDVNVYRLFDDFDLGNQVYLSTDKGRMQYRRQAMRVFGATVGTDDEGNEIISEIEITQG